MPTAEGHQEGFLDESMLKWSRQKEQQVPSLGASSLSGLPAKGRSQNPRVSFSRSPSFIMLMCGE